MNNDPHSAYYLAALQLEQRNCLVVGGGQVALRKARELAHAGAKVSICAKAFSAQVRHAAQLAGLTLSEQPYQAELLEHNVYLVIAATDDSLVNQRIAEDCRQRRILVNVVDAPADSSFITPAIVRRGDLQVAISTAGKSPMLARLLRARLELLLPSGIGDLLQWAGQLRQKVKTRLRETRLVRQFWKQQLTGELGQRVVSGQPVTEADWDQALERFDQNQTGQVWLVGAGPGDPGLLTLRAYQLLQEADVILYDALVSAEVLALARKDAKQIAVGKRAGQPSTGQQQIQQLMIQYASQGCQVVRLKGGDPVIFGRLSEEIAALQKQGIPHSIVPGITAASGCAATLNMPLTDRLAAHGVTYVSGQLCATATPTDWRQLVGSQHTLVIYMGLKNIRRITQALLAAGLKPATSAMLVERGTGPEQRVYKSQLQDLPKLVEREQIQAPALAYIGAVTDMAVAAGQAPLAEHPLVWGTSLWAASMQMEATPEYKQRKVA